MTRRKTPSSKRVAIVDTVSNAFGKLGLLCTSSLIMEWCRHHGIACTLHVSTGLHLVRCFDYTKYTIDRISHIMTLDIEQCIVTRTVLLLLSNGMLLY